MSSWLPSWLAAWFVEKELDTTLPEEDIEEFKMLTSLEKKEIVRTHQTYMTYADVDGKLSIGQFYCIPSIACNPLCDRIAIIFGYNDQVKSINFKSFICSAAIFNSSGGRDQKLRVAFQMQDFDNDDLLSREDLKQYINLITKSSLKDVDIDFMIDEMFKECVLDSKGEYINFTEFQRVLGPTDFHARLRIPLT